jgi:hypothetical protein
MIRYEDLDCTFLKVVELRTQIFFNSDFTLWVLERYSNCFLTVDLV